MSCSVDTMRITPSLTTRWSPFVSSTVWNARSQGTFRSVIDILPLTSSPMTMFFPLSAARMRRRLTTSASLKSNEMRWDPFAGAGAGCAGGAAWATRADADSASGAPFAGSGAGAGAGAAAASFGGSVGAAAVTGAVGMTIASPSSSSRMA